MGMTRESIAALSDRAITTVAMPEWGMDARLRPLSGIEMDSIHQALGLGEDYDKKRFIECVTAMSLCDDDGARIYTPETSAELFDRSATATGRLVQHALIINRLGGEAQADARKD